MINIPDDLREYYRGIKPQMGYIYYFLGENLKNISRDQLKIGVGFYRTDWIDGAFLFEANSYLLKGVKEYLAARHLKDGNFPIWSEWTEYYAKVWGAVGLCRLMGTGSFYLTGHGSTMILRKKLDELPGASEIGVLDIDGESHPENSEGYLVYHDPGGGAHVRNWKLFYVVLADILSRAGVYSIDEDFIESMSDSDPGNRFVIKSEEEIYGFPSLFRVKELTEAELARISTNEAPSLDQWVEAEAQFDGGGFTEEFKAYYKFMMDHYGIDQPNSVTLAVLEHGITWFLATLPDDIRPSFADRYYELVDRYSANESTKKMMFEWLDRVTAAVPSSGI